MNKKNDDPCTTVVKKRGRKSKKELEELALQKASSENINVLIEESNSQPVTNVNTISDLLNSDDENDNDNDNEKNIELSSTQLQTCDEDKPVAKKRGRKPKGGKIIQQIVPLNNNKEPKPNVILHLKCSLKDLQSNLIQGAEIQSFNFQPTNQLTYDIINSESNIFNKQDPPKIIYDEIDYDEDDDRSIKENDTKEVWKKLKVLEHNLHINNISDKKSACFWCTYEFDNPPVYIPKHFIKDSYHVYGCFCSPECGTAYLMEENIDSSAKFERYHLINHIYSKIYDYKKNIKPAPNPYYMLEKYYGNLTIQEYRSLLRNERLFLVVDKPLTRILPELHEDNDDFIINNKIIPSNNYQFKRKLQKKQTKNNILSERFGLSQQQ
jgi:hypothetical protein